MNNVQQLITEMIEKESLVSLTLSGPRDRDKQQPHKVVVRPFLSKSGRVYQFEYHSAGRVVHRNLVSEETSIEIGLLLNEKFKQAHFRSTTAELHVLVNKRGEAAIRSKPALENTVNLQHNRQKDYIIAEGNPCDFLVRLGVMTAQGRVIAAKYDKYKQVNRFLEMVADVVPNLDASKRLDIVDFGCGKSYLTFALYYYLHVLKGFDVHIIGLDLKQDVIEQCQGIAEDLGYTQLTFRVGDIKNCTGIDCVDMVVTLHACDTATDDALAKAIGWGAIVILSVPCCQHELFRQVRSEVLQPMLIHGIVKERLSALITDSIRAQLLEFAGYSVQMLEFIDMEHTPKNILIRAIRHSNREVSPTVGANYQRFRDFWHVSPYLETILPDSLQRQLLSIQPDRLVTLRRGGDLSE
jgi:SAM-dependent methyltransferase